MSTESRPLYYLRERIYRKWLNDIYVGLTSSTENCEHISNTDPDNYDFSKIRGSNLARTCMRDACHWLQDIRPFIKDDHMYKSQFLKPVQITAEYIQKIRQKTPTTSIRGWVFSKSEPYDDSFGIQRTTISMIVPSLKTIMSIRMRSEESSSMNYGYYEFGEVLPVPLVNRLRQSHPKISPISKQFSLKNCDFLKVFFEDFEKFSDSIEMSNFCEIDSTQSKLRHHLGSAFVVACTIIRIQQPRITIKSIISDSTKTLVMSDQLLKNYDYDNLDSMKNKNARLLAIRWYDPENNDDISKKTEVVHMELEEKTSDLKNDELIGYVRMRNVVTYEKAKSLLNDNNIDSIPCLQIKQKNVKFRIIEEFQDHIINEFLHTVDMLKNLRASSRRDECIQLNCFDVVDEEKISFAGLTMLVKKNAILSEILNKILYNTDMGGKAMPVSSITSNSDIQEEIIRSKIYWLKHLELLEKIDGCLQITSKGKKIIFAAMKDTIRNEIYKHDMDVILLPEFETKIPPNLLCKFLENPESGYIQVILTGGKNKLFWAKTPSDEITKLFQEKIDHMKSEILQIMRIFNYPFTTLKAIEELSKRGITRDFFTMEVLIRELAKEKILLPSGESWELTLKSRIFSLIEGSPNHVYTFNEIRSSLSIPKVLESDALDVLDTLQSEDKISKMSDGEWSLKGDEMAKSKKRIQSTLYKKTLQLLKTKQHGLDGSILESMMNRIAVDLCKGNKFVNRQTMVKESIKMLNDNNAVSLNEGIYKIRQE